MNSIKMHLKIIFLICIVSFTTSISVDSKLDFERSKRAETGDFKLLKLRKDASNLNESTKNSAEYKSKITDSRSDSSSSEEIDSVDVRTDPAAAMSNESLSNEDVFSKNETLEEDIPIVYGKIPSKIYFQEFTKQPKWFQNLPLFMWTTERVPCYLRIPILEDGILRKPCDCKIMKDTNILQHLNNNHAVDDKIELFFTSNKITDKKVFNL